MSIESNSTQILNLTNTYNSSGQNNILRINLNSTLNLRDYFVALSNLQFYYSYPNISPSKNNTTFEYIWIDSTVYSIVMPEGLYTISDISGYLQNQMVLNGHYLVDNNGDFYYFISIEANRVYQKCTITVNPVPAVLPTGWTNPASIILPASDTTPQLTILGNGLETVLGITAGDYPSTPQGTQFAQNGQNIPQITDVIAINCTTNLINTNFFNQSPNTIYTFSPQSGFAELINERPPQLVWYECIGSSVNYIELRLTDQLNRDLNMLDPTFCATLYLRKK